MVNDPRWQRYGAVAGTAVPASVQPSHSADSHPSVPAGRASIPERATEAGSWQLEMFSVTLKKQQKLALLCRQLGDLDGQRCLLITNGDNNGALNYHLRAHGGTWTWVENESAHIQLMSALLGEPVRLGNPDRIPVGDRLFDVVVSIDVHEHLDDCASFTGELQRITRPGGRVIVTTPNGDPWKPATVLKQLIGMRKEEYGHTVLGYNVAQHERMMAEVGLEPTESASCSKLFTELLELAINFAFVKVLPRLRGRALERETGTIAPSTRQQLTTLGKQYRLYSRAYPLLRAISSLDVLLFPFTGYAVSVVGRRPK